MIPDYLKNRLAVTFRYRAKVIKRLFSVGKGKVCPSILILSHPRSGSTLLHTYLNSHPNIWSYGEGLNQNQLEKGSSSSAYIERLLTRRHPCSIRYTALKIFFEYCRDERLGAVDFLAKGKHPVKLVYLERRNLLRVWVSLQIAHQSKQWTLVNPKDQKDLQKRQIRVSLEHCLMGLQQLRQMEEDARFLFSHVEDVIRVDYDELANRPQEVLTSLQGRLGLPVKRLYAAQQRQNPEPLSSLVENFEEIKEGLLGTKWERFIGEEDPLS